VIAEYFLDTWFFIALANRFDEHHSAARRLEAYYSSASLVTHDAVLSELLAFFSGFGSLTRQRAVNVVRETLRNIAVEPADRRLFLAGLDRYAQRIDKEYSHVDCMSMVLMEKRGIVSVLTNDHHFSQAGFNIITDAR
jgi:uncharacterized protein